MDLANGLRQPVIKGVRYALDHAPGLVRYGHKPSLDISRDPQILARITSRLRTFEDAVSYPPNRAFLGEIYPDDLRQYVRPWFRHNGAEATSLPHGEIISEEELLGLLKICDAFDLVWLEDSFAKEVKGILSGHRLVSREDLYKLDEAHTSTEIEGRIASAETLPLWLENERLVGCINGAGENNVALAPNVLLENLSCKATATFALRTLLQDGKFESDSIDYILNTGEEAVGDSYQRGGGNMAKAVGEMCGLSNATGSDVKAFCCAPVHALVMAGAMVCAGVFKQVAVVGGCSLPKLGMNYQGHLDHEQPILEDVLASVAIIVGEDDGRSPLLRLDSVGSHKIGAGSSLRAISRTLMTDPLARIGLGFKDIDKYAIELQNPEITEPIGAGDVTERNYRIIAGMAVQNHEIERSEISQFSSDHGMPGFASTQGNIASAIPFLGHAVDRLKDGNMRRAMFIAKGSLFLGRMTQMSDGFSFILERNSGS